MCCLQCVFCKNRGVLPRAEHVSAFQTRACVCVLQLYARLFSALSGFTLRLLTPTAFVPIQREFPRQFHLWLRHVFTWLTLLHLSPQSYDQLKSTTAVSLQKTSPSLSITCAREKTKLWRQSDRVWMKNRTDNTIACVTAQQLIIPSCILSAFCQRKFIQST